MQGIAVMMVNADHRNAITELHQAFGSCLMVIADDDAAAAEGVTIRKNKTHWANSHPFHWAATASPPQGCWSCSQSS